MQFIFATHNQHKLTEISQLLRNKIDLLSLNDVGHTTEIEENGKDLLENALIKARTIFNLYGKNTFADDTGLEIEALDGQPGVYSARFAGEEKDANANMNKVLKLMHNIENRKARFRTIIALIVDGNEHIFEGIVNGTILREPKGNKGFGYDPIFQPDDKMISFAEMDAEEKNRISHRGKAIEKLIEFFNNM
ncbi:RdgB/HAM1 family non-canonical purine NTP pyrophosphatase [Natronoflexus pectinivorans]|uniref:dITP/XTP pyrophosphatase n=1 Tax=Natronoflexus pectinivorans TaxID=682526 RepID=A0A4R2GNN5_9BACT|nr:RdgB/HAM1 family non-canonical purine NTP pyrophosphatase [Natronoflexus pectinivorans]TCO10915.1 XTP/dITP diphosphohydrolase [Natronoflexus pectinivorans]